MKSINLSKKAFKNLEELYIPSNVIYNEAKIYEYTKNNKDLVIKSLKTTSGEYYATKLYTVQMLNSFKDYFPENFIIPDTIVTCNGENIGFAMPKIKGLTLSSLLEDDSVNIKIKINALKSVGKIIKKLEGIRNHTELKDIFINDLHECNFVYNPLEKNVNIIDLDSVKIGSNKVFASRYLDPFSLLNCCEKYEINNINLLGSENNVYNFNEGFIKPDKNTDIYCYVIMLLNFIFGKDLSYIDDLKFYEYLNILSKTDIDKELIDCISKIIILTENENPLEYLDCLNTKTVKQARQKAKKLTR